MIPIIILCAALAVFSYRRLKFASKFLQQDDYNSKRFFKFIFRRAQLIDKRVFPALLILGFFGGYYIAPFIAAAVLIAGAVFEKNPIKSSKKKMVITKRWQRIFVVAFALSAIVFAAAAFVMNSIFAAAVIVVLLPLMLICANIILIPVERSIQNRYIKIARKKLAEINPINIGITGSFGKTSVKNILYHILSTVSNTYATPRSINTIMGVVRLINEELRPEHKYFIVEMGTDAPNGSLGKLCELIRPTYGILTAIGAAHLENFRDMDELAKEKAKLPIAVGKLGGHMVINGDAVAEKYIEKYAPKNSEIFKSDMIAELETKPDGLHFTFNFDGASHKIFAPVFGEHQASNIALAFMLSRAIGVPASTIISSLRTLPQTPHRLEVLRNAHMTIVDDGFNSNPGGFKSALKTTRMLADASSARAIIVTPGIIELGSLHASVHTELGQISSEFMDIVIAVSPDRFKEYTNQIHPEKLVCVPDKKSADAWLAANAKPGDVVLYENDLPDLFEEKINI
ncbi:MAG: UDP-N-acetylmuramoyl-tripeptide--D-alanyl-D-alanine ligase [Alphaproteobacteria bacterium]|nr:UDP-N-acetylmuramoyl-tripeptide--D-alanyl-D-alanine ligase [Alphaproteobacteria bacterium]